MVSIFQYVKGFKVNLYFYSLDTSLPAVGLSIGESRSLLWEKVKLSARHIYTNYLEEYDWFFKADDDTYDCHV